VNASSVDTPERERFVQLYVTSRVGVLGYLLRRVPEPSDAADLLAETYLVAWRRIKDVPDGDEAILWLYGVARRVLSNFDRHVRVERTLVNTLRSELKAEAGLRLSPADGPFSGVIRTSLDAMGSVDREILELSAWEHLTPTEIAHVLGMRAGTVRVRLHRARGVLRASLVEAGFRQPESLDCEVHL
jgi:RNA polymerase sigma factor (sigma-70 family)